MISQDELNKINELILSNQAAIKQTIQPGVESYLKIQDMYAKKRIDAEFKQLFRSFYRVRGRINQDKLWDLLKQRRVVSIVDAMNRISNKKTVQLSFASKALHTISPDLPIYDRTVRVFFRLPNPYPRELKKRLAFQEKVYNDLKSIYAERKDNGLVRLACAFDTLFPQYKAQISEVKKIDFMIWGYGR